MERLFHSPHTALAVQVKKCYADCRSFKHDFPLLESGLKPVLGHATLIFFTALGLALERERPFRRQIKVPGEVSQGHLEQHVPSIMVT